MYYDNFIVLTPNEEEARAWEQRVKLNEKRLHVVIKEGSFMKLSDEQIAAEGFTYLGVHFQTSSEAYAGQPRKMTRKEYTFRPPGQLIVHAAKRQKWQEKLNAVAEVAGTCREAASWVGRAIFCVMCSGERVQKREVGRMVIAAGGRVGKESQRGWDTRMSDEGWALVLEATRAALDQNCLLEGEG